MSLITPDFGLLVWMTLIFSIVLFILAKWGFPMITRSVRERAERISASIRKAKEDAEAIRAKAEAEATERLDGLNEERDALTKQITELKATAANYRQQFEQLLQAQQEALEKATNLF